MAIVQDELVFDHAGKRYRPVMIWDDDDTEPRPLVAVCGTILGRNEFAIERARTLQAMGYVGIALDIYGDGYATDDHEAARPFMMKLLEDRKELRQRLSASVEFAARQPVVDSMKLAVIGFCFGGLCALDVARTRDDVSAVASFHGLLTAPPRTIATPINAKVLVLHGTEDPLVPPAQVDALREELSSRGTDWQIHIYGSTYHSFAVPGAHAPERGLMYNEHAATRAWQALDNLLNETF